GRRLQIDDRVNALGLLVDLEREPATAPDVELLHRATRGPDHIQVLIERRGHGALLERRIEDHHEFVMTQDVLTSCGLNVHGLSVEGGLVPARVTRGAANRASITGLSSSPKSEAPACGRGPRCFSRGAPDPHSLGGTWGGTTTPMRLDAGAPRSL